jgi:hypothetical protein
MIEATAAGQVIFKTEHLPAPRLRQAGNAVGRFPEPGDGELLAGPARNFQVFDPLDFPAEVTQHVPDPGSHLVRYYGWYSNKTRGQRAQRRPAPAARSGIPARSTGAGGPQRLGGAHQTGLPSGSAWLSSLRGRAQNHRLHRAATDRGDREDPPPLWTVGGALSSCPALGQGLGCRLRLRSRGPVERWRRA